LPAEVVVSRSLLFFPLLSLLLIIPHEVHAEARGVLRVGVAPVVLTPESDTPYLGTRFDDAVRAYNAAADAYNRAHGFEAGSAMSTERIDRGDLGVSTTMLTLAPALEAGERHLYMRLEVPLGFGADHRSYGLGFYPLNVAVPVRRGSLTPYLSAGGSVSWLDDTRIDGEFGLLLGARVAGGMRVGRRVTVEVGYNAYSIGGLVDTEQLDTMSSYDPRGDAPPPHPETAIAGGEQSGAVDISLGFSL
jgi:hypothetical protein